MITLEHDALVFRFPELHAEAEARIEFQRTLRIPDDDRDYPLPPGLGPFPLRHLDDFANRLPPAWSKRGGVIMPMHQSEALWLNFSGVYPCALRIATGKIDAVTGETWKRGLSADPQNYIVVPTQPWLDGYAVDKGTIRQFVAMPLGEGYTAEEQLTGAAEHGGLQIEVFPMKPDIYARIERDAGPDYMAAAPFESVQLASLDMGLAPGGRMIQEIYDDPYGLDAWEAEVSSRCFVSIANSLTWAAITEVAPPTKPPSAADYTAAGLPWFDYYGGDRRALKGAEKLAKLKSVKKMGEHKGETPMPENESVEPSRVITLDGTKASVVREGDF
ncbi:MAG: hypothetical protein P8Z76_02265 [Alphaproteobacteria bacterium]